MPQTYKVKYPVQVDYLCDECGEGYIRPTGMVLTTNPPWHVHRCPYCKKESREIRSYPHIEFMDEVPTGQRVHRPVDGRANAGEG